MTKGELVKLWSQMPERDKFFWAWVFGVISSAIWLDALRLLGVAT